MRKSLFLTLVLSLCVADFGAFAATVRGNPRGTVAASTDQQNSSPVSARVARQRVVSAPASSSSVAVSARSGTRQKMTSNTTASGSVTARATTKKAALSMGTKVAVATENTVVSQECQDAYYGCMDTFCMLDNATGGRCQCSDRSAELDAVLDEIMRVDEQSVRLATEGVEQIQMGDYANQINARAKSVESGISDEKKGDKTARSLDLESLASNNFFDVEYDDVFENFSSSSDDITNKTGDALQKAASSVCTAQIPAECKSSLALLQTAYVSKVKSDCIGYENALKQQRNASQQKLLAAQKSVREAALDEVRKQNRYETAGECAIAFAQCMQTTAECGADYTGCVTLAAAENVKNNASGVKATQTTIKSIVSGVDITIAASTMEALLAKKEICASVTKQCVNANKNDAVWDIFLRNAAPALKSAELIAEQNLRSNCIPAAAECFKNACKAQFNEDDENYDICLSNPKAYMSFCKVQLEPCLEATGGDYNNPEKSFLWNGLVALLESMKVDTCTKQIKDCLLSEDICGKDFAGCVGLDSYSIARLCPAAKLTACMNAEKNSKTTDSKGKEITVNYYENEDAIYEYVAKVAQGLALNIENSFATVCQNAVEAALVKACGDGGSDEEGALCPNLDMNLSALTSEMRVAYYVDDDKDKRSFYDSVDEYASTLTNMKDLLNLKPIIVGQTDVYGIQYEGNDFTFSKTADAIPDNGYTGNADELKAQIKSKYELLLSEIESNQTVTYCMSGHKVEGFNDNKFGKNKEDTGFQPRFPNLLNATKQRLASQILNTVLSKYNDKYNEVSEQLNREYQNLAKRIVDYVDEDELDSINKTACESNTGVYFACGLGLAHADCAENRVLYKAEYKKDTNQCVIFGHLYWCDGWRYADVGHETDLKTWCQLGKDYEPKYVDYPKLK